MDQALGGAEPQAPAPAPAAEQRSSEADKAYTAAGAAAKEAAVPDIALRCPASPASLPSLWHPCKICLVHATFLFKKPLIRAPLPHNGVGFGGCPGRWRRTWGR